MPSDRMNIVWTAASRQRAKMLPPKNEPGATWGPGHTHPYRYPDPWRAGPPQRRPEPLHEHSHTPEWRVHVPRCTQPCDVSAGGAQTYHLAMNGRSLPVGLCLGCTMAL